MNAQEFKKMMQKESKYHSKKITVGGETFDSSKEYRRFCELKLLQRAGKITDLQRQVKFVLIPTQREPDEIGSRGGVKKGKVIEQECAYVADFVYKEPVTIETTWHSNEGHSGTKIVHDFETVVEDTKGFRTADYIIKRKLMLYVHGIRIRET